MDLSSNGLRKLIIALTFTALATAVLIRAATAQTPQPAQAAQPQNERSESWFDTPTKIKVIAETVAWAAAALFFAFKAFAGYMFINMSIAIEPRRCVSRRRSGRDDLAVRAILTKGDRATLQLGLVEIVVEGANPSRLAIDEIRVAETNGERLLNLTPGETTHFERCFDVESSVPFTIVVTVRGKRRGCWKASAVSLPCDADTSSNERSNRR